MRSAKLVGHACNVGTVPNGRATAEKLVSIELSWASRNVRYERKNPRWGIWLRRARPRTLLRRRSGIADEKLNGTVPRVARGLGGV